MSRPSSTTVPLSGCRWPVIRLKRVDLPAPFGPITAAICCVSTRKLTSDTATKPANVLRSAVISSIAETVPEPGPAGVEGAHDPARKADHQHAQDRTGEKGQQCGEGGSGR